MKLISFRKGKRFSWGAVVDGGIVDLGKRLEGRYPSLRSALEKGALPKVRKALKGAKVSFKLDAVTLLPPIPRADKIILVGLNYEEHRKETGRDKTARPVLFTRFNNTQIGHNQPLIKPRASDKFDYEGELAVIIGKSGRAVSEAVALSHVAGYSCYHDGSVRDWQFHTSQFTPGKNFPATGGFGPWLVTADEIPDPHLLPIQLRLNGQTMQNSNTQEFIFGIDKIIAYVSQVITLEPGDVIFTGTPPGVGMARKPPVFLKPGDVVEVEIEGLGVLRNPVAAE